MASMAIFMGKVKPSTLKNPSIFSGVQPYSQRNPNGYSWCRAPRMASPTPCPVDLWICGPVECAVSIMVFMQWCRLTHQKGGSNMIDLTRFNHTEPMKSGFGCVWKWGNYTGDLSPKYGDVHGQNDDKPWVGFSVNFQTPLHIENLIQTGTGWWFGTWFLFFHILGMS